MEEMKNINVKWQELDDMVMEIGQKIHHVTDLLGLAYLGMMKLNSQDDSYELSTVSIVEDYLKTLEKEEITVLHEKLEELKEASQP